MRHRSTNRAFTLIEILIVVVILGILAAIVIPQFTSASDDAQNSSVQSQLQTVRGQIELYNVQQNGYPATVVAGTDWSDMIDNNYLMGDPRNAMRDNATGIVAGAGVPGDASGGAAGDGWYWNTADNILYAIAADGSIMDF